MGCSDTGNHFIFLCYFIGRSNQINSVLVIFVPTKKTGPNRPLDGKFMAVLRDCSRFHVLHTGRPGKFIGMWTKKPCGTALILCVTHWKARKILLDYGWKTLVGQIMFVRD